MPTKTRLRVGRVLTGFAFLAAMNGLSNSAFAAGTGQITGTVSASPGIALEQTVVYLQSAPGSFSAGNGSVNMAGLKLQPQVLAVTVGATVTWTNHDGVDRNLFSTDNEGLNLGTFKTNEHRSYAFNKHSNVAYRTLDAVHPLVLGFIFVGQNPYHCLVGSDGSFTLKNVPAGPCTICVWNSTARAANVSITLVAGGSASANFSLK